MLDIFNRKEFIIFKTRDYAVVTNISMSAASKKLRRLVDKKLLVHVTKGVWANASHPYFHPLSCVPYILNNEQGYVSFLTALHFYGILSQIPKTIQIATTGHSRKLDSPVAYFKFIQLKPELMCDEIEWSHSHLPYLQATPEKSLFDTLYIATRKNRRFTGLPELELTSDLFKTKNFKKIIQTMPLSNRILNAMKVKGKTLDVL